MTAQASLISEVKKTLDRLDISARKSFGQNFMVSEPHLARIAELAVQKGRPVLEIGPGLGFLTRALYQAGAGAVMAVEKDRKISEYLRSAFSDKKFELKEQDVLELDLAKEFKLTEKITIVGNIPYNITSPILEWLIQHRAFIGDAILTVQKEVAERVIASVGTRACGALSIFLQVYSTPRIAEILPPQCFFPPPNVQSAVLEISFLEKPLVALPDETIFFAIVRRAFQKRRKTILNALRDDEDVHFSKESLEKAFKSTRIVATRRPETLTLTEWNNLARAILTLS